MIKFNNILTLVAQPYMSNENRKKMCDRLRGKITHCENLFKYYDNRTKSIMGNINYYISIGENMTDDTLLSIAVASKIKHTFGKQGVLTLLVLIYFVDNIIYVTMLSFPPLLVWDIQRECRRCYEHKGGGNFFDVPFVEMRLFATSRSYNLLLLWNKTIPNFKQVRTLQDVMKSPVPNKILNQIVHLATVSGYNTSPSNRLSLLSIYQVYLDLENDRYVIVENYNKLNPNLISLGTLKLATPMGLFLINVNNLYYKLYYFGMSQFETMLQLTSYLRKNSITLLEYTKSLDGDNKVALTYRLIDLYLFDKFNITQNPSRGISLNYTIVNNTVSILISEQLLLGSDITLYWKYIGIKFNVTKISRCMIKDSKIHDGDSLLFYNCEIVKLGVTLFTEIYLITNLQFTNFNAIWYTKLYDINNIRTSGNLYVGDIAILNCNSVQLGNELSMALIHNVKDLKINYSITDSAICKVSKLKFTVLSQTCIHNVTGYLDILSFDDSLSSRLMYIFDRFMPNWKREFYR